MSVVTCIAPVNIAVVKYWGKRDDTLNLPINDSISGTLDTEHLCAKTSVMISPDFQEDRMWLNGSEQKMDNPRLQNCLQEIKKRSQLPEEMKNWKIRICSENNFPTAAGLASSAAGYACLAVSLAKLHKVQGDISGIARVGSGSACRSVYGGFVRWYMGSDPLGCDSIAKPITPASHWPEMRILILVVSDSQKKVASTVGMRRGVLTSDFLKHRANTIFPDRVTQMHKAIVDKNFELFAELTMKDSNNMHAACLDTYPPCVYMNDVSHSIVDFVHSYNAINSEAKVAYTFDAGPNATLYLLEKDVAEFSAVLDHYFPPRQDATDTEYRKGIPVESVKLSEDTLEKNNYTKHLPGKLKYIIQTRLGDGPKQLHDDSSHLLSEQGLPLIVH